MRSIHPTAPSGTDLLRVGEPSGRVHSGTDGAAGAGQYAPGAGVGAR
jgi:hypothetical protein